MRARKSGKTQKWDIIKQEVNIGQDMAGRNRTGYHMIRQDMTGYDRI